MPGSVHPYLCIPTPVTDCLFIVLPGALASGKPIANPARTPDGSRGGAGTPGNRAGVQDAVWIMVSVPTQDHWNKVVEHGGV
jgi:hypothetical protein